MKFIDEIVFGRKPIEELMASDQQIDKLLVEQKMSGEFEILLRKYAKDHKIPLSKVPQHKLDKLCKFKNHQGVIAFISATPFYDLDDVLQLTYEQGRTPLLVILDNITDLRNIGAIARSAYWFGADAIVYSIKNAPPINSLAVKISAGALLHIPVCRVQSIVQSLQYLKDSGITILGTGMLDKQMSATLESVKNPLAVVMGSEERGMSREVKSYCDEIISIPGKGNLDSLNVSVATGVVLYEIYKQREAK